MSPNAIKWLRITAQMIFMGSMKNNISQPDDLYCTSKRAGSCAQGVHEVSQESKGAELTFYAYRGFLSINPQNNRYTKEDKLKLIALFGRIQPTFEMAISLDIWPHLFTVTIPIMNAEHNHILMYKTNKTIITYFPEPYKLNMNAIRYTQEFFRTRLACQGSLGIQSTSHLGTL